MRKFWIFLLTLVLGIVIGWLCRPKHTQETESVPQTDTVYVFDTITIDTPVVVYKEKGHLIEVPVRDTIRVHDTLYMQLQTEKKIYKGEDYYAEVSGYCPRLDYIQVYPQTRYIKETKIQPVDKTYRVAAGVEMAYIGTAYIPIYLEYGQMLHKNIEIYAKLSYDLPTKTYGMGVGTKIQFGW